MTSAPDHSLRAALYDATHRGQEGDLDFYIEHCGSDRSLLELGCGSGRVLRALTPRPGPTAGLDIDAGLLSIAKEELPKEVELFLGDMRDFRSKRRFQRIILPFNGVYCLEGKKDLPRLFATVRHHLARDGEFILDCYPTEELEEDAAHIWPEECVEDEEDHILDIQVNETTFEVYERTLWYPQRRRFEVTFSYEPQESLLLPITQTIVHNYFPVAALIEAAKKSALELVEHRRGFFDVDEEELEEPPPHVLRFRPAGLVF